MRTISVYLDDTAESALNKIMDINKCSITDAVVMGLLTVAQEEAPLITPTVTLWGKLKHAVQQATNAPIAAFCITNAIQLSDVRSLCNRVEKGSQVKGFGSSNKWRDKQDGRLYKTRTAYIYDSLRRLGIDLEALNESN